MPAKKTKETKKVKKSTPVKTPTEAKAVGSKSPIQVEKTVKETLDELLEKLHVEAETDVIQESPDSFKINIKTAETGLFIGHHGETINSLQLILGVILFKKLGSWVRTILDVGDYRKTREEHIQSMVSRIIEEVETTKQEVVLPFLTPLERRVVHMMLSNHPKVVSESQGEGRDRLVHIKPRQT